MTTPILLAVDAASSTLSDDDAVLARALFAAGYAPRPHQWGMPVSRDATVIIRSTWDYVDRPALFHAWLDHLESQRATVHNHTDLLRWNMHKSYLDELAGAGLPVVPTLLLPRGSAVNLERLVDDHGWHDAVVKPAIGGTARLTAHAGRIGQKRAQQHLDAILAHEDALVQPFLPSIEDVGETSVIAIAGRITHAVAKRAASGDWRVQSDFGGSADRVPVTHELHNIARQILDPLIPAPLYARIDLVRDLDGRLALLELELVEPELFFGLAPEAADLMAAHLTEQ